MRRLPPGTSFDVIGEVEHLRYQIARADALLHAAEDRLERVGNDRQRREHVAHLVDLAKQATATALAMTTTGRLAAATAWRSPASLASSAGRQHFLYFLPLPQWHVAFRPIVGAMRWGKSGAGLLITGYAP